MNLNVQVGLTPEFSHARGRLVFFISFCEHLKLLSAFLLLFTPEPHWSFSQMLGIQGFPIGLSVSFLITGLGLFPQLFPSLTWTWPRGSFVDGLFSHLPQTRAKRWHSIYPQCVPLSCQSCKTVWDYSPFQLCARGGTFQRHWSIPSWSHGTAGRAHVVCSRKARP